MGLTPWNFVSAEYTTVKGFEGVFYQGDGSLHLSVTYACTNAQCCFSEHALVGTNMSQIVHPSDKNKPWTLKITEKTAFSKFSNHGAIPVGDFHLCAHMLTCRYVPPTPQKSSVESAMLRVGLSPYKVAQHSTCTTDLTFSWHGQFDTFKIRQKAFYKRGTYLKQQTLP